ncbi:hypothetical protein F4813DRAFT_372027 [Daldinia decipiens]|uniref:uncharacterized protein n=1 Tax=Daldinia decipiens TaxID=326647 RepID=UPI0020C38BEE|nr:uncharacterized protein F4813DRAFT_372027 [Daldinia decipiens]KAI1654060.1 hypothetical protein F4813DRAFT_372027 [Daldinia decipiens]
MTTPARLEEGHEMNRIPGSSDANEGPAEPRTRNNNAGHENFRGDSDFIDDAPAGWPSIAATQLYYPNFSIHRRFSYLLHRVLIDQETKLAYLENELEKLDKKDKENDADRLNSLPFDPETLLASHTPAQAQYQPTSIQTSPTTSKAGKEQKKTNEDNRWDDKDLILESAISRLKNYHELLLLGKETQNLPRISRREHRAFYDEVESRHTLFDASAYQFLYPNDDFVTTNTDRVHHYFERLIYGDTPIKKLIKGIFGRTDENFNLEIDNRILVVAFKVLVVFTSGLLLLSPVAILLLVNLSRSLSFVVVVVFSFAFVAALTCLKSNWDTILVGLSAYMAVLVTFLSNLEQGKT